MVGITFWQTFNLTQCEQMIFIELLYGARSKPKDDLYRKANTIFNANCVSTFTADRNYLDVVCGKRDIFDNMPLKNLAHAYFSMGLTLYNIGYQEDGLDYIRKSISICEKANRQLENDKTQYQWFLCTKLNAKKYFYERYKLSERLYREKPDSAFDIILVKSLIDCDMLDDADFLMLKVAARYSLNQQRILEADLLIAKKEYQSAAEKYYRVKFPRSMSFWRSQFDYKKALAFFYSNREEDWRKQTKKIAYRKHWDKYYDIDNVSEYGIQRIPEIDEAITGQNNYKFYLDADRLCHYFFMAPRIFIVNFKNYWHYYFYAIVVVFFIAVKLVKYLN